MIPLSDTPVPSRVVVTIPHRRALLASMQATPEYVPSLDGLRAVSVLLVLFGHLWSARLVPGGLGVLVFFVISGFLITRLLLSEWRASGRLNIWQFWRRRIWRLYPAVVAYCVAVVLWKQAAGGSTTLIEPLAALGYAANYLYAFWSIHHSFGHMPLEHFWSLSIEEHFYVFFPVFLVFGGRTPRRVFTAMVVLCAACLILRLFAVAIWPWLTQTRAIYYTELRADSLGFGVMLAALCEAGRGQRIVLRMIQPDAVAAACLGLVFSLACRNVWFRETLRYSIEAASVAVLLAAVLFSGHYRFAQVILNWQPLVWVGVLSYSLYVWHPLVALVLSAVKAHMAEPVWLSFAIVMTFSVSALSYYGIEAPLRTRFARRATSGLVPVGAAIVMPSE